MKQKLCFLLVIISVAVSAQLYSQEVQMSVGLETGLIVLKENMNYWTTIAGGTLFAKGTNSSIYWASGISLMVRAFKDADAPVATGFVFRDRALFTTNYMETGNISSKFITSGGIIILIPDESWSKETYSVFKDDFFMYSMDFDLGYSTRISLSKKVRLYADLGVNLTIMKYEEFEGNKSVYTFSYLGAGIFSQLSLQTRLTDNIYMEFGLNAVYNAFSSQKSEAIYSGTKYGYSGTGKWDSPSISVYLNIGWRLPAGATIFGR